MSIRVLIACGGTGGHLFPGIAVAERLRARGHEALAAVSEKKVDATAMRDHPDTDFVTLPSIATPPLLSPRIVPFAIRLLRAIGASGKAIRQFRPDVVLGMGGFTSFPALVAARLRGIPVALHESNAYPGRANRLGARFASQIFLGFPECAAHFPGRETRDVGTPVRSALARAAADPGSMGEAHTRFDLDPARPTVLVVGGSQGAKGLNERVFAALQELAKDGDPPAFLHLAGAGDYDRTAADYATRPDSEKHHVAAFIGEMDAALAAADIAVARSGASTLNELALFGIPSILLPYPYAADDHQHLNAEAFVHAGGAILAPESETDGAALATHIRTLLGDGERAASMRDALIALAPEAAADRIADALEELAT